MLDGILPVGGGIADVFAPRAGDLRKPELQDGDDFRCVVHRQGCLRGERQIRILRRGDGACILGCLDQGDLSGVNLTHGAFDLWMAGMPDQQHMLALRGVPTGLNMHFGDQRAGGVNGNHVAAVRLGNNSARYTMCREDDRRALRNLFKLLDKDRALGSETVDHSPVVNNLMPHIDRRAEPLQRNLDNANGPIDPGTEPAGRGKMKEFPVFCHGLLHVVVLARLHRTGQLLLSEKADRMRRMKHQTLARFLPISTVLGGAAFLAACAGDPVYVACPEITAPPEGTAAFRKIDVTGEVIDVRMNGVRGLCQPVDGGTRVDVAIGLKMKRPAAESFAGGVAEVEVMAFIIDADDKVVRTDTVLYKTGFRDGMRIVYPVAEYSDELSDGQRLVLALVPEL